ncbi:hypothetical protein MJO28_017544 [Puccinia striiformis f. sp. tritici]|nr:hypothetical protein MJO28_017544 [Puccinia striiformis f. sp. tritici]
MASRTSSSPGPPAVLNLVPVPTNVARNSCRKLTNAEIEVIKGIRTKAPAIITGQFKVHSVQPRVMAHDPDNLKQPDFVLLIDNTRMKTRVPDFYIATYVWVTGELVEGPGNYTYIQVEKMSINKH